MNGTNGFRPTADNEECHGLAFSKYVPIVHSVFIARIFSLAAFIWECSMDSSCFTEGFSAHFHIWE